MKLRINIHLVIVLISIFLFWILLAKDNFFHMDDWEWINNYQKGFWGMVTTIRDGEHFYPLSAIIYYFFLRFFGLTYVPFHVLNITVHIINSYLVYKITIHETNSAGINIPAALLFGFASTAPDILVWAVSYHITAAGFFLFLGSIFFCTIEKIIKRCYSCFLPFLF